MSSSVSPAMRALSSTRYNPYSFRFRPRWSGGAKPTSAYHLARTAFAQIDAQLKMIELRKLQGLIAEVAPMVQSVQATHIAARTALMQLPDRLAQLLAPEADPVKVHELLRLECERICDVMKREVERLRERAAAGAAA